MFSNPEMLKAIAAIIAAIIWPAAAVILAIVLFPWLKSIITTRGFQVKFGSVEVSVQDATDKFQDQLTDLNEQVRMLRAAIQAEPGTKPAELAVAATPPPSTSAAILWVDDKPDGNALETAQLKARSIDVVQARSTAEGMRELGRGTRFAAVVSDMGRTEDGAYHAEAGLELLKAMRDAQMTLPFFVYTGRRFALQHDGAVRASGGGGATASTIELFEWIDGQVARQA